MRVLAKADIPFLPGPDDYFGEPTGMVTLSGYVIHGIRVETSDWSAHDATMVLRSLRVSASGAKVVDELRIKPPPLAGPVGGNGMSRVEATMTMNKLDDSRMLVVIIQGRYEYNYTGATDNDEPMMAVVVSCDSQGALTQGVPVSVGQRIFVDGVFVGFLNLTGDVYPAVAIGSTSAIAFSTCVDSSHTSYFKAGATFQVSGMSVGPAEWAIWAGSTGSPAYAFVHNGVPYLADSDGISSAGGTQWLWPYRFMQIMRSATVRAGSTTWLISDEDVMTFTAEQGPKLAGWSITGQNREFATGLAWSYRSERDLLTLTGQFLVWDLWDTLRIAAVPVGGKTYDILDLAPHLPDVVAVFTTDESSLEAGTMVVLGRLALVEVMADHLDPTEVDSWGRGARYLIVELSPPPKLGPSVQGAHFD